MSCEPVKGAEVPLDIRGSWSLLGFSRHRLKIWLSLEHLQESNNKSRSWDSSGRET